MIQNTFRGYRATEKPRCKNCKVFMSESEGHNRTVCSKCNAPNTYWIDS